MLRKTRQLMAAIAFAMSCIQAPFVQTHTDEDQAVWTLDRPTRAITIQISRYHGRAEDAPGQAPLPTAEQFAQLVSSMDVLDLMKHTYYEYVNSTVEHYPGVGKFPELKLYGDQFMIRIDGLTEQHLYSILGQTDLEMTETDPALVKDIVDRLIGVLKGLDRTSSTPRAPVSRR